MYTTPAEDLPPGPPPVPPDVDASSTTTRASSPPVHTATTLPTAGGLATESDRRRESKDKQGILSRPLAAFQDCTVMKISADPGPSTCLPVVEAAALDAHGQRHAIPILLDTGSTASFVTVSARYKLRAPVIEPAVKLNVSHLGGGDCVDTCKVKVTLLGRDDEHIEVCAYSVPKIFSSLPAREASRTPFAFKGRGGEREVGNVELLLGVEDFAKVVDRVVKNGSYFAFSTCWGYVPCGRYDSSDADEEICHAAYLEELSHSLERFWRIEEYPSDRVKGVTEDETHAINAIEENLCFDAKRGRFATGLLFRGTPHLMNNYRLAAVRLHGVLRKLQRDHELADAYVQAIQEYIDMRAVEKVSDPQATVEGRKDVYYLPHRAVFDPSKITSKCRIVFDASANTASGRSLNSFLMPGPALQLEIPNLALRFRSRPVVLIGDISKMFLNIDMKEEHRDYLRFLWKSPYHPDGDIEIYRFTTIIFGATDSPFQANTCLRKLVSAALANPHVTEWEKRACQVIMQDTYVDDITMGGESVNEVYAIMMALKSILEPAHFFIKKWKTNSPELLSLIPEADRAPTRAENAPNLVEWDNLNPCVSEESKMLGVGWDPGRDVIRFRYNHLTAFNDNSKTAVASLLAKIYDPLGLVAPYVLKARYILKCAHSSKLGWKDHLPEELMPMWNQWLLQIPDLEKFEVPRYLQLKESTELHVFSDASGFGYGYAAYLRNPKHSGAWEAGLLMARARVAPMKELTIPKLELVAAEMTAKAAIDLARTLGIEERRVQCWTDSEIVLHWLSKDPHTLVPFMANRIRRIQQYGLTFLYIPTKDNPADIASRGCEVRELSSSLWLQGPRMLTVSRSEWPPQKTSWADGADKQLGVKKQYVFNFSTLTRYVDGQPALGEVLLEEYHSSYQKLISQTAGVMRAFSHWKTRALKQEDPPRDRDWYEEAQRWWHKEIQQDGFGAEIRSVKDGMALAAGSPLLPLTPFLDPEGLLRVSGRLARAEIPWGEKHPIILDRNHRVVTLLIREAHTSNFHAGNDWLHHHLRQKYWIPSSRVAIKMATKNCLVCLRGQAAPGNQLMAQLPTFRVNESLPFLHVGVDYAGVLNYDTPTATRQGMLLVFTCMSTRAVHLEVTDSKGTPDFLLAWHRMMGTRGHPTDMYSDNGKTFGAVRGLLRDETTRVRSSLPRVRWHFSTPGAPHTGGIWERVIQLVKRPLRKAIGRSRLTFAELSTLCKEIEGLVNDRPLAALAEDAMGAITPSMLIAGRRLYDTPETAGSRPSDPVEDLWEERQTACEKFWDVWGNQYRQTLQRMGKWNTPQPNLRVGDLVVMEANGRPRFQWPLARVQEVIADEQGLVRRVKLLAPQVADPTSTRTLIRSVHSIYPLECTRETMEVAAPDA